MLDLGALDPLEGFVDEADAQRVVFAWGAVSGLPDEVSLLAAERVLLIAERSTASIAQTIADDLGDRAVEVIEGVRRHVPRSDVDETLRLVDRCSPDLVMTVGGGSATGLGKAVAIERSLRLLAVPTTYA